MGPHPERHKTLSLPKVLTKPAIVEAKPPASAETPSPLGSIEPLEILTSKPPAASASSPLPTAEQQARKQARLAALAWLKTTYPNLFDYAKPLAIGSGKVIVAAALEAGMVGHATRRALHGWTPAIAISRRWLLMAHNVTTLTVKRSNPWPSSTRLRRRSFLP
jgi:hypothetical protein